MIDNTWTIERCSIVEVRDLLTQHYLHKVKGDTKYTFKLEHNSIQMGTIVYGGKGITWKSYVDSYDKLVELRRLFVVDNTPRNIESFLIGYTLRWLKRNTPVEKVITYADPNQGHTGTIYKASNFKYIGDTKTGKKIFIYDLTRKRRSARIDDISKDARVV